MILRKTLIRLVASCCIITLLFSCFSVNVYASEPKTNIPITTKVESSESKRVGDIWYDDGMGGDGTNWEFCKVKTTSIVRVKGDMPGQPTHGSDKKKGEGFSYVTDDKNTKKDQTIDISLSVGYKAISCSVSVPVNIFKRGGKSKAQVTSSTIIAPKKGRYKAYGNVTYTVTKYTTFKRPDTRGMSKEKKEKVKWVKAADLKTTVVPRVDSSYCRYIGPYGKD